MAGDDREKFEVVPLAEDVLYVAVATDHPLSKKPSLSVADLRHETWAIESTWSTLGAFITDLCRSTGYEPRTNARCRGPETIEAIVASGCSVSIIPGLRVRRSPAGVAWVKLTPEVRRKIYVAYRRDERSLPTIKLFVEEIVRTASRLLGG